MRPACVGGGARGGWLRGDGVRGGWHARGACAGVRRRSAQKIPQGARAASTLRTGVLRVSRTPGRRVQGAREGVGARYGSACVGAARARAEWGRRLSNLCWYVGGGAFCFCCPDVAKVHRLSKRMSCCSLKSPDPPLPDTPVCYVVGALLCGKSKTKQFHPSPIRARPAQAAGI